jgi:spore maturation protein CgeB
MAKSATLRPYAMFRAVTGFEYANAISCSTINLGLLQEAIPGAPSGDRITSRTFHIPACGGLMLHERTDDLLRIFEEDKSCVCFAGPEELASKVDLLLAGPESRKEIARVGQSVVEEAHSWDHRARAILDHYVQTAPTL